MYMNINQDKNIECIYRYTLYNHSFLGMILQLTHFFFKMNIQGVKK